MAHYFRVQLEGRKEWKFLALPSLPRSCGCDGSIKDWLDAELEERGYPVEERKILAVRQLRDKSPIGVRKLYVFKRDRAYGGPEEGGWYRDVAYVEREFTVPARSYARHRARLERYAERVNEGLRSYDSDRLHVSSILPSGGPDHYC